MAEKEVDFASPMPRTCMIRVSSYVNRNLQGYLSGPYFGEAVYFENLMQLLMLIDQMLDDADCPQRSMECRRFSPELTPAGVVPGPLPRENLPTIASFQLSVLFRQHTSWQGSVCWLERGPEKQYRSVMELICLLDGALSSL